MGIYETLKKTRELFRRLVGTVDTEELKAVLLSADVGIKATEILIAAARRSKGNLRDNLKKEIIRILSLPVIFSAWNEKTAPLVIMVVGVNGVGKTTTVGKLSYLFNRQGKKVVIAAADTYRDAAAEQLKVWASRAGVEIVSSQKGQDAAAVAFDTLQKAQQGKADVVLIDTAGRLHTRYDLMAEAEKIKRVCGKVKPGAPEEILLVLDATIGQNGIRQAQVFHQRLNLTGIILTKLDGTAKGGIVIPVAMEIGVPIRFIGTGEGIEDLAPFVPEDYVEALFED
ncbi:MAG: signal recognition particle-docking protein FtsY [candidate division WOR-3 bacterium]